MEIKAVNKLSSEKDIVISLFYEEAKIQEDFFDEEEVKVIDLFLDKKKFNFGRTYYLFLPTGKQVLFIGKGKKSEWNLRKYRILTRRVLLESKKLSFGNVFFVEYNSIDLKIDTTEVFACELLLAEYVFDFYKKITYKKDINFNVYFDCSDKELSKYQGRLDNGTIIGIEVNNARSLNNTPGEDMTPDKLALHTEKECKRWGVEVEVFDVEKIKNMKMGGVYGVGKGSKVGPKFLILKHMPNKEERPIVFTGKGVTFDTGGLNLKPDNHMNEMHMDMSGGASVIHGVCAIARLKIPVNVIGLVPVVENAISRDSYRPGDILTSITGKTIEVKNTDAEGRVILADALGYAQRLNPKLVIDIATLTGAALGALGTKANAFFTNEDKNADIIKDIGEISGDYMWQLPLWEEYENDVKGIFGDVSNLGKSRYGGAVAAAMFLKAFVEYSWVHIDMAPTMTSNDDEYLSKGSKGTGVRFFVYLARRFANS